MTKILRLSGSIRSEIFYHDINSRPTGGTRPWLSLIKLFPSDPQVTQLVDVLKVLRGAETDTRLIIQTNSLTRGLHLTQPSEAWGYVVEADDNAEMLVGLHSQFLDDLIGFLSAYLEAGEIWPSYADYQLINQGAGDSDLSTTFEVRVAKSGTPREGDISAMFE